MSTFVATPPALAPKSFEVSFIWEPRAWAVTRDSLSTGDKAHREQNLHWSPAPWGGRHRSTCAQQG